MSALFTACEADAGFRQTGKPAWRKCGDVAACRVTVPDEDCRIALCQPCADWLDGLQGDLAQMEADDPALAELGHLIEQREHAQSLLDRGYTP